MASLPKLLLILKMNQILDISLPLYEGMIAYPGTAPLSVTTSKSESSGSTLSTISLSSHTGTHIDAPSHVMPGGKTLSELPLETFYGQCRVLDVTSCVGSISRESLETKNIQSGERILLKTSNSARGFVSFYDDYIFLSPEAAAYLAEVGVVLVGIDALSVKQRGNKDNTPHTNLLSHEVVIMEGINLANVEEGTYILCAFPLALSEIDGSPCRAVLLN